ncbi:uncharacterized protein METZ01_LOCUS168015, partial [marine metagenome]
MLLSMKKLLGIVVLCLLSSKAIAFTSPTLTSELEINSYDSTPRGLAFNNDGTKFFTTSFGNKEINAFKLNTAWDLSTAVHLYAHTIGYNGRHLAFNSDGTQLFFLEGKVSNNASVDRVYRYTLSTPFDVRTRTYNDNFVDVSSQQTATSGLEFSPDGKKMYIIGTVGAKINQYTLSTAWDLTTAVHGGSFGFEDSSGDDEPLHATFNYDGTKMWMTGWIEDSIFEYDLSTAWDVTTADLVGSFDIGTFDDGPSALVFSQDASKLFVLAATGDKVGEYKLYCTYGILACRDPTSDKDDVASVESQTESAKQLIQHTTYPVLNRMEWLRRNNNNSNLTNQNIKFQFSNEILASLLDVGSIKLDNPLLNYWIKKLPDKLVAVNGAVENGQSITIGREYKKKNKNSNNLDNFTTAIKSDNPLLNSWMNKLPEKITARRAFLKEKSSKDKKTIKTKNKNWSYWSHGDISFGRKGDTATSKPKEIRVSGLMFGADKKINNNKFVGAAVRFGKSDIESISPGGIELDNESLTLNLYGTLPTSYSSNLNALLGVSLLRIDQLLSGEITGERNGKQVFTAFNLQSDDGYGNFNIRPTGRFEIGITQFSQYTDFGTSSTNSQDTYDSLTFKTGNIAAGFKFDNFINIKEGRLSRHGSLEYI